VRSLLAGASRIFKLRFELEDGEGVRPGPLLVFIRHASVAGTDVVFLAHFGFEGTATFHDLWRGELIGRRVRVRLRRVRGSEIPSDRDAKIDWLYSQWAGSMPGSTHKLGIMPRVLGSRGRIVHTLTVRAALTAVFDYRFQRIREIFRRADDPNPAQRGADS
jgi:hypothetical protein